MSSFAFGWVGLLLEILLCAAWFVGMAGLGGLAVYAVVSLRAEPSPSGRSLRRVKM